jgi:hypothetical protein
MADILNPRSDGRTIKVIDELGVPYGVKQIDGKPRVSAMPYTYDIGEGNITGHTPWTKIGFSPTVNATESSLWSKGGAYVFASAAFQGDVVSDSGGNEDVGTSIFNGTSNGGSTTTLIDTTKTFTGGTAVEVGDCIVLDKSGTIPEWGYVTTVAATTLTCSSGFSSGGTGSGRAYTVVDKNTAGKTGAHVVKFDYLTTAFAEKTEMVLLNGNTPVNTVNTDIYRINSFRIIAAGSGNKPVGNLSLRVSGGGTTYSYITAGFTRARNNQYTVPAGKTLYIIQWAVGWATPNDTKVQIARFYTRANREPATGFKTGSIFYPYTEIICANTNSIVIFEVPTKIASGFDIMVNGLATTPGSGPATSVLRGWLE